MIVRTPETPAADALALTQTAYLTEAMPTPQSSAAKTKDMVLRVTQALTRNFLNAENPMRRPASTSLLIVDNLSMIGSFRIGLFFVNICVSV